MTWVYLILLYCAGLAGCTSPDLSSDREDMVGPPTLPTSPIMLKDVPRTESQGTPTTVALVLPLSGQHKPLGQALTRIATTCIGDPKIVVRPVDSAAPEWLQTVSTGQFDAIVGPVFAPQVRQLRDMPHPDIPILALTNDMTAVGRGVYGLGVSPTEQADFLAAHWNTLGVKSVAVLAPDNAFGKALVTALSAIGAPRLSLVTYFAPNAVNLPTQLQAVLQTAPEAIFIPEGMPSLGLVAQELLMHSQAGRPIPRLFGSLQWVGTDKVVLDLLPAKTQWIGYREAMKDCLSGAEKGALHRLSWTLKDAILLARFLHLHRQEAPWQRLAESSAGIEGHASLFKLLPTGASIHDLEIITNDAKQPIPPEPAAAPTPGRL